MEKDIAEGNLGSVGSYDVEFKGGKLRAEVKAGAAGVSGGAFVELEADVVIDKAFDKLDAVVHLPGEVDHAVIELVKTGLKAALKA